MTACSKPVSSPPAQVVETTAPPAGVQAPAPAPSQTAPANREQQARDALSRGDFAQAIDSWKAISEQEPTADHFNELSYAYIAAGRWQEALEAGKKALKLQPGHIYATYNTALAALELDDMCQAMYMKDSVTQQPDRYEPHMGLARVYLRTGEYALALDEAQKAVALAGDSADARAVLASIEAKGKASPPADLTTTGVVKHKGASLTLYAYPEKPYKSCYQTVSPYALFAVHAQGPVLRLQTGTVGAKSEFIPVGLPGGAQGFFVPGGEVGAHVANSRAFGLLVDNGREFYEVVFHNDPDSTRADHGVPAVGTFMRSGGVPTVEGHRIVGHYQSDANGYFDMYATWLLAPDLRTATLEGIKGVDPLEPFEAKEGVVVSVTRDQVVILVDGKETAFPTAGVEFRRAGWPAWASDLKPGARVNMALRDGKLLRLEFGW